MAISTITAVLPWDVRSVWNTVTSVRDYTWRSDLERTEIRNERQFVEFTKKRIRDDLYHYRFRALPPMGI